MDQNVEVSNEPGELVLVEPLPTLAKPTTPFSGPQMLVLYGVGNGNSLSKAALLAGVHRTTVHGWRQENPDYEAAFQEWKRQAQENGRAGIVSFTDLALDAVEKRLRAGDAKVALVVLKSLGALDREKVAPTDAAEISDERMLEAEQKKIRRDERRQKLLERHLKNAAARSEMQNAVAKAMAKASPHHALPAPNPAQSAEDEESDAPGDLGPEESAQFTEEQLEQLKAILWEQKQQEKAEDPQPPPDDNKPAVE